MVNASAIFDGFLNAVLPPRCAFTGDIVDRQGIVSPEAWKNLSFIAKPYCPVCGAPFEFATARGGDDAQCASCLKDPPAFAAARSVLAYNDGSRDLILGFKHGDRCEYVATMTPWLRAAGAEILADADCLVPVPLHRWRLLRRRYNQSALMAYAVAKEVRIPCYPDALLRQRATPPQGHLNAKDRRDNVRKAFTVNPKSVEAIRDKKIVLVDDVFTSGATVNECAGVLVKAGAAEVRVLTFAKVVRGV